jgi:ring-1,2-phenylacetyl-CoA epoxidase subunit PaaD
MQETVDKTHIMKLLREVKDPEIPVLDVVEMGSVRDARVEDDGVHVVITPTYSGCPAMEVIRDDVAAELKKHGISPVHVDLVFSPPWTTEWMDEDAKQKMRDFGIAPPNTACANPTEDPNAHAACPYCGSRETELRSTFSSTACKAFHFCNACIQPFEYFKCI